MGLVNWFRGEWAEAKEAGREIGHFCRTHDWKKSTKSAFRPKYWAYWIIGIILIVGIALVSFYRDTIVGKFEPHKDQITGLTVSWIYPVIILVILSFPPLGGHEIVLLVVGLIWGLWIGFAIAAAGTLIGEILCFYLFKFVLTSRAAAVERKSVFYACIARLMRDGGLWIIVVVRFSAVPGHVVTAIQSTVGMNVFIYSLAIIASMPKQLVVVWLGVMFGNSGAGSTKSGKEKAISWSVLAVTGVATLAALYIVYMRARKLYPEVLRDMEARSGSKDSLASTGEDGRPVPARRQSLVSAAFAGEEGIDYTERHGGGGGGERMERGGSAGTWGSGMSEDEFRRTPQTQQAWQDGSMTPGGSSKRVKGGERYDPLQIEAMESYTHLPMASESEVGMSSSQRATTGSGANRGALSSSPYQDPFANPQQQQQQRRQQPQQQHQQQQYRQPDTPPTTSTPYGTAPYGSSPSSSSIHIPLQHPSSSQQTSSSPAAGASIPYLSPPPPGSRPTSMGGTELMTGVGSRSAAAGSGHAMQGGMYGAMGERR